MNFEVISKELYFKTSRSGGKGGQNVNKVETQVELLFDIQNSFGLNEWQKLRIFEKLKNRISSEGILSLTCSESRSQLQNKKIVKERFYLLLEEVMKVKKPRKASKPGKMAIERRLKEKKIHSEKKKRRNEDF